MTEVIINEQLVEVIAEESDVTVTVEEGNNVSVISVGTIGPQGPSGSSIGYIHTQSVASSVWTVNHNLNKRASVTIVDSGDNVVIADIHYVDDDNLTITFTLAITGAAYCN